MSIEKTIISEIPSRETFFTLLRHNPGVIVLKFGADWCGPCHRIEKEVQRFFAESPEDVICCDLNVDLSSDLYSFLKSKKMVNGIPALLCYEKGNTSFIPDASVTGADVGNLHTFFTTCGSLRHHAATIRI
jgi:thiol-disulfide isomerase/thioredoxin